MSDEYQFWRDTLAGKSLPMSPDHPCPGYYKMRIEKNGEFLPVAIWRKDGELVCRVGKTMRDPLQVWTYCADKPVSKEAAKAAFETGAWPGDIPQAGHNAGDLPLPDEINDTAEQAIAWLEKHGIKDKTASDMAANWRSKLLALAKRADVEREAEKRPHLEASREVDARYKPMIERAQDAANRLRDALTVWMRAEEEKARKEAEAKRKAEEARVAAERARIESERAKLMRDDPIAAMTSPEPDMPELPIALEPVKIQAGGQRGKRTGLKTAIRYEIEDYAAALAAVCDHEDVRAAVEKVATARMKAGVAVPGVRRIEERVAA